ncbi:MAG: gliding motility-associated C-terminal domain-containing protein [Salibacteraceae bacterium]|nr:gliding motility-associated C-terminal domain-containing protein [Salibacteraceae bacterium]MDP4963507.1 gliding motility-associated C-terminal domain-containing protein [Salibacteraceae bacterium]
MKAFLYSLAILIGICLLQLDASAQEGPSFRGIRINPQSEINCLSNPETIGVTVENWIPGLQYLWNTGEVDSMIQVKPLVSTSYSVTISHPDFNSIDVSSFQVDVTNNPITIENQTIEVSNEFCPGAEVNIEVTAFGGHGELQFEWNFGASGTEVTVAPVSSSSYIVTVMDECLTKSEAVIAVKLQEQKPLETVDQTIPFTCSNQDLELTVDLNAISGGIGHGYTFRLKGNDFDNQSIIVSPKDGDVYVAQVTDECGIQTKDLSIKLGKRDPIIPLSKDEMICKGSEIDLTASEDAQFYLWREGQLFTSYFEEIQENQMINLIYIDECGEQHSINKTIKIDEIEADFESNTHIGSNTVDLKSKNSNYETYQWYLNGYTVSTSEAFELELVAGTGNAITLVTTNKNGCTATNTRSIVFRDGVDAPTAFTPDGDGLNDVFTVRFEEILVDFKIEIFNRWGQLIYKSNDQYFEWNGFDGNPENQFNSFVYKLIGTTSAGTTFDKNGTITIIRTK